MKIKEGENGWKILRIESIDDLWYLKNIIDGKTLVRKTVMRREDKRDDMDRNKESKRKPVTVTVSPEEVDFQPFTDRLRIWGEIREGPEGLAGQHQSVIVSADDEVDIWRESWDNVAQGILKESLLKSSSGAIFVSMDDEYATIFTLRDYGLYTNGKVYSGKSGKEYAGNYSRSSYFSEILRMLGSISGDYPVIITGPGFEGEYFYKYLQENNFARKIYSIPSANSEESAVFEIIGNNKVRNILGESRLSRESEAMDMFLKELGKDGNCTYGRKEIRKYAEAGAIEKLLVLESFIRDSEVTEIMDMAEKGGAEILIVSESGNYGQMLRGFGGYVAITRFKI